MLGHKMLQVLSRDFQVFGTLRSARSQPPFAGIEMFQSPNILDGIDATNMQDIERALSAGAPSVVINCVGTIKQRPEAQLPIPSILTNALLPHQLSEMCAARAARLIHVSTDCVFSGNKGDYTETDATDAEDLYGKSKALGEVTKNGLTLRTSIIGRELQHKQSLLEWLLAQNHKTVHGFTRHYWSGVTTNHLAELVRKIIVEHPLLEGLYQVSSGKLNKNELLHILRDAFQIDVEIVPDDVPFCDRSLDGSRLRKAIGYEAPEWPLLARQLADDSHELYQ